MRIIGGKASGRNLVTPPGRSQDIRPTADRAREALFNILGRHVPDARVLDLFAGTGALGLEALSRGAASVVLIDFSPTALSLIERNVALCADHEDDVVVIRHDLRKGLPGRLRSTGERNRFDLIFLDPPYGQGLSLRSLQHLDRCSLLAAEALIVAEDRSTEKLPEEFVNLGLIDRRSYGDTGFWIYRNHGKN